ncbi:hypothetical protein PITCH_A1800051 [uncultured Desulfobacterium sp.]|uniref:Uncharacterized protein n=1 Tax=uncultured Desulfobacterium sp. TaxID=201089 RepID=A0A445MV65_9BACT|nr:hypothetical protein PITCH_A1800051 [uncultured Desulfobacterium sp.]
MRCGINIFDTLTGLKCKGLSPLEIIKSFTLGIRRDYGKNAEDKFDFGCFIRGLPVDGRGEGGDDMCRLLGLSLRFYSGGHRRC